MQRRGKQHALHRLTRPDPAGAVSGTVKLLRLEGFPDAVGRARHDRNLPQQRSRSRQRTERHFGAALGLGAVRNLAERGCPSGDDCHRGEHGAPLRQVIAAGGQDNREVALVTRDRGSSDLSISHGLDLEPGVLAQACAGNVPARHGSQSGAGCGCRWRRARGAGRESGQAKQGGDRPREGSCHVDTTCRLIRSVPPHALQNAGSHQPDNGTSVRPGSVPNVDDTAPLVIVRVAFPDCDEPALR